MRRSVSVVIPTLGDRVTTLEETLRSVDAQRRDVDVEIIAVMPETALDAIALAERFDARVVLDPRQGISHASNLGMQVASHEWFTWLGDDDLLRPGGLLKLTRLMLAESRPVFAYGGCDYVDESGRLIFVSRAGSLAARIQPWGPNLVPLPATMFDAEAVARAGRFESGLRYSMDLDLFLRLRSVGSSACTRTSVAAFRWHTSSTTVSDRRSSSREAEMVRRRHLPAALRPLSPLWHLPVRAASAVAAHRVSRRADRMVGS